MTVVEVERPKAERQSVDRAAALMEKLLSGRKDFAPKAARALGIAVANTDPKSEHGQLLASTVRRLRTRMAKLPETGTLEALVWLLACRGVTPTAAAVEAELGKKGRRAAWKSRWDAVEAAADVDGPKAAAFIVRVVAETGAGPGYTQLRTEMGWQSRYTGRHLVSLVKAGWVTVGEKPRSMRPGPAWVEFVSS